MRAIVVECAHTAGPFLFEKQEPAQQLIRERSGRAIKLWDRLLREGHAARLHRTDHGHVVCMEAVPESIAARAGPLAWTENTVVTIAGHLAYEKGGPAWWTEQGCFAHAEDAMRAAPAERTYASMVDALRQRPPAPPPPAPPPPPRAAAAAGAPLHAIWLYEYEPRWLPCGGASVWRLADVLRLPRVRSRRFESPMQLYRAAMLEILYEYGGCVLAPRSGACAAPLRSETWRGARGGRAARPHDPALLYWFELNMLCPGDCVVPASRVGMVVYVNLDRCADKRDEMDQRLFVDGRFGTMDIVRFPAVDGACVHAAQMLHEKKMSPDLYMSMLDRSGVVTPSSYPFTDGALGCAESHIRVMQMVVEKNVPTLVLEDDVRIAPSLESTLATCDMDSREWDLIYCDPDTRSGAPESTQLCPRSTFEGTFAFIIKPSAAKAYLSFAYPIFCPIDIQLKIFVKKKRVKVLGLSGQHVRTTSVFQDPSVSSIARTRAEDMRIPRVLHISCDEAAQAAGWAAAHPGWDARVHAGAEAEGAASAVFSGGGVFVDARRARAPSGGLERMLLGLRGFACAEDSAARVLSGAVFGLARDHPLAGEGGSFDRLARAWAADQRGFLASTKVFHRRVFHL
jgi:hypothetical protein